MQPRVILCPVDLSPLSHENSRHALAVAATSGARVVLLHVVEPLLVQAAAMTYDKDYLQEEASRELSALVDAVARGPARDSTVVRVRVGLPHAEILQAARDERADLIVAGTHAQSGPARLFFGSTTLRVLREAAVPILAIPPGGRSLVKDGPHGPALAIGRVVAAVDFSDLTGPTIEAAASAASRWQARLLLAHIVPEARGLERFTGLLREHQAHRVAQAEKELELLAGEARQKVSDVRVYAGSGRPEQLLGAISDEEPGTLLVMGLRHSAGMLSPQPGSTAYQVLCLSRTPVLVVPARVQ
ncbi:MAG TPA: universal stress protein [Vicinamibacterales bacterium]